MYLHFLSFLHNEITNGAKSFPIADGSLLELNYEQHSCWWHQQPWYGPSSLRFLRPQHQKGQRRRLLKQL